MVNLFQPISTNLEVFTMTKKQQQIKTNKMVNDSLHMILEDDTDVYIPKEE